MKTLLEVKAVTKHFPGVLALDRVDFDLRQGEVHALLSENGAGKSTLVKIITGAYTKDSGEIIIDGQAVHFHSPADAQNAGVGIIYQEFSQITTLSVAENIYLGRYPKKRGLVDWGKMQKDAQALLTRFKVNAHPQDILHTLGNMLRSRRRATRINMASA
jgi:ribose transport system ATP-binding protein